MAEKLHPVVTVRLFGSEKCFGPGVSELLRRVDERHSLRAAAQSMEMAYSKAWTIIKHAEKELGFKLLISSSGGKNGGGALLTDNARHLVAAYDSYCTEVENYAARRFDEAFDFCAAAREAQAGHDDAQQKADKAGEVKR